MYTLLTELLGKQVYFDENQACISRLLLRLYFENFTKLLQTKQ